MKKIIILPLLLMTATFLISASIALAEEDLPLTATASSYYVWEPYAEYPPSNAVDGSLYTYWFGGYPEDTWWLQLDCGAMYELCSIAIWWKAMCGSSNYDIQISTDAITWTNIYTGLNTTGLSSGTKLLAVYPLAVTTRFVRIYIKESEDFTPQIAEVKIFGGSTNINQRPIAEITYNSTMTGYAPLEVSFTEECIDFDGSIVSYSWDLGDGATSNLQNPIHTYNDSGRYTARLTVTDDDGATDIDSIVVNVDESSNQAPTANASASPTTGEVPLTVTFSGSGSDPDGTIAGYSWNFGGGATSTAQNPNHIYNNSGNYNVTLTVTDDDGATGSDSVAITVNEVPNQAPTANASASPTIGEIPLQVTFTGSGTDSDGTITSYSWDFGDGITSNSQNTSHTYNNIGTYSATLTVADDDGATDSDAVTITVNELPNQPPTANAGALPISGEAPLEVTFTGGGYDSDGSITGYSWDFGDGTSSMTQNPIHAYDNAGTYTATLTVTDDDGATDSDTVVITVTEPANEPPTANANAIPVSGEAPLQVQLTGSGTDPDGTIASYNWDLGDGTVSTLQSPVHTYQDPETYNVILTVEDDDGATTTDSVLITVDEPAPPPPPSVSKEIPHFIRFQGRLADKSNMPFAT